jgi:hypothetical protein
MEDNESTFCALWAKHIRVNDCADLFINRKLDGDYFFNRLDNVICQDVVSVIDQSVNIFLKKRLDCYVYIHNGDKQLEYSLLKKGFIFVDTMNVLKYKSKDIKFEEGKILVTKIDIDLLPSWIDVFCEAFNVCHWRSEVEKIFRLHFNELILLLSYIDNNSKTTPAGCIALFNRFNLMGIYCLGTVSSFRGRGVAKEMIKSASKVSLQYGTDYLFLQSFSKEGFTKLYKKIGFELLYKKKVYALYQAVDT